MEICLFPLLNIKNNLQRYAFTKFSDLFPTLLLFQVDKRYYEFSSRYEIFVVKFVYNKRRKLANKRTKNDL